MAGQDKDGKKSFTRIPRSCMFALHNVAPEEGITYRVKLESKTWDIPHLVLYMNPRNQ